MPKMLFKNSVTSVILRVRIKDTTSVIGAGKTGLTFASAGLIISTIADNEATATPYTQAAGNIETISTLGTFAAPTSGKCRFKEVDATNHPGLYEIQIANARWAVSGARSVIVSLPPISGLGTASVDAEIQLTTLESSVGVDVTSISGSTTAADNLEEGTESLTPGSAATGTLTTTQFTTNLTATSDYANVGAQLTFKGDTTTATLRGVRVWITAYNGSTKAVTVAPALPAAPANGDLFVIS